MEKLCRRGSAGIGRGGGRSAMTRARPTAWPTNRTNTDDDAYQQILRLERAGGEAGGRPRPPRQRDAPTSSRSSPVNPEALHPAAFEASPHILDHRHAVSFEVSRDHRS